VVIGLVDSAQPLSVAGYLHGLFRELGIVAVAVCGVSLIYEQHLAEKHQQRFLGLLRAQFEEGHSNAAVCAQLGIRQIFPTRSTFEIEYPLQSLIYDLGRGETLRAVGRSLYQLMCKAQNLQGAVAQGARIELCLFDPRVGKEEIARSPDVRYSEIESALHAFLELVEWLEKATPTGVVELRFHRVVLLDSCLQLKKQRSEGTYVWDLSFGRDFTEKRILRVDPSKPLGADLRRRYELVWEKAEQAFLYADGVIRNNAVSQIL
jgi:hypothetical protein